MINSFLKSCLIGALLLFVAADASAQAVAEPATQVTVDWTQATGLANRALFSVQGFMFAYAEPHPMVMQTFSLINPTGTHTRLETWIHRMEPVNDNDDPNVFNWEGFQPERMIRLIEDRAAFERMLKRLGMEPLSLMCYNVDWLKSDNPDQPVADLDEWAEFAAAVVQSYNGTGDDYRPRLKYAQIWNEPNFSFWDGTDESFFELYNTAAARIRRDYPGVMVGGPTLTPAGSDPVKYMDDFLAACGANTDYIIFHHYGPMGEGPGPILDSMDRYLETFRALPGKQDAKAMITETDAWFQGWAKQQFILDRQFRFIDRSEDLLAVHHFCVLRYNESGNYDFGIIDRVGGVIPGTFWPYWLFRNWMGETSYGMVQGDRQGDVDLAASRDQRDGGELATAILRNRSQEPVELRAQLFFESADHDRVLAANVVSEGYSGLRSVERIAAGVDHWAKLVTLEAGAALSFNLLEAGQSHLAFRDLNNQRLPWVEISEGPGEIKLFDEAEFEVRVLNTLFEPVSGRIRLGGMPESWQVRLADGSDSAKLKNLAFGEEACVRFVVRAAGDVKAKRVGIYAWLDQGKADKADLDAVAHSIAASLDVNKPLLLRTLPSVIKAVAGETNQVTLKLTNSGSQAIKGRFSVELPVELLKGNLPKTFELTVGEIERIQFPVKVSAKAAPGSYKGVLKVKYLGIEQDMPFTVEVMDAPLREDAVMVDLSAHLNFDAVASEDDRSDFDSEKMGNFSYPADFTPSGRVARVGGIPFSMPALDDGLKTVLLPQGQKIEVPAGNYEQLALVGFGHDGKHPGRWTLHYDHGEAQSVESAIPEWCTEPAEGVSEAFGAPHRYLHVGNAGPACQLWSWTLPVDATRRLTAIEMPEMENAYLFAATLLP